MADKDAARARGLMGKVLTEEPRKIRLKWMEPLPKQTDSESEKWRCRYSFVSSSSSNAGLESGLSSVEQPTSKAPNKFSFRLRVKVTRGEADLRTAEPAAAAVSDSEVTASEVWNTNDPGSGTESSHRSHSSSGQRQRALQRADLRANPARAVSQLTLDRHGCPPPLSSREEQRSYTAGASPKLDWREGPKQKRLPSESEVSSQEPQKSTRRASFLLEDAASGEQRVHSGRAKEQQRGISFAESTKREEESPAARQRRVPTGFVRTENLPASESEFSSQDHKSPARSERGISFAASTKKEDEVAGLRQNRVPTGFVRAQELPSDSEGSQDDPCTERAISFAASTKTEEGTGPRKTRVPTGYVRNQELPSDSEGSSQEQSVHSSAPRGISFAASTKPEEDGAGPRKNRVPTGYVRELLPDSEGSSQDEQSCAAPPARSSHREATLSPELLREAHWAGDTSAQESRSSPDEAPARSIAFHSSTKLEEESPGQRQRRVPTGFVHANEVPSDGSSQEECLSQYETSRENSRAGNMGRGLEAHSSASSRSHSGDRSRSRQPSPGFNSSQLSQRNVHAAPSRRDSELSRRTWADGQSNATWDPAEDASRPSSAHAARPVAVAYDEDDDHSSMASDDEQPPELKHDKMYHYKGTAYDPDVHESMRPDRCQSQAPSQCKSLPPDADGSESAHESDAGCSDGPQQKRLLGEFSTADGVSEPQAPCAISRHPQDVQEAGPASRSMPDQVASSRGHSHRLHAGQAEDACVEEEDLDDEAMPELEPEDLPRLLGKQHASDAETSEADEASKKKACKSAVSAAVSAATLSEWEVEQAGWKTNPMEDSNGFTAKDGLSDVMDCTSGDEEAAGPLTRERGDGSPELDEGHQSATLGLPRNSRRSTRSSFRSQSRPRLMSINEEQQLPVRRDQQVASERVSRECIQQEQEQRSAASLQVEGRRRGRREIVPMTMEEDLCLEEQSGSRLKRRTMGSAIGSWLLPSRWSNKGSKKGPGQRSQEEGSERSSQGSWRQQREGGSSEQYRISSKGRLHHCIDDQPASREMSEREELSSQESRALEAKQSPQVLDAMQSRQSRGNEVRSRGLADLGQDCSLHLQDAPLAQTSRRVPCATDPLHSSRCKDELEDGPQACRSRRLQSERLASKDKEAPEDGISEVVSEDFREDRGVAGIDSETEGSEAGTKFQVVRFSEKGQRMEDIATLSLEAAKLQGGRNLMQQKSAEFGSGRLSMRRPTPYPINAEQQAKYGSFMPEGMECKQLAKDVQDDVMPCKKAFADVQSTGNMASPGNMAMGALGFAGYRRADCRFTAKGCALFTGIDIRPPVNVAFDDAKTVPICGGERNRALVLMEHADDVVDAIRSSSCRCSIADAAALELPGLLHDLSATFTLHMRGILEPNGVTAIDGTPTALALLIRLVEVLDVLVAPEEDPGDRCRRDRGGEATDLISGRGERSREAVDALVAGLGPRGFLPPCLDCLSEGPCLKKLQDWGAEELASELKLHATLAVRLVLCWTPPLGVPRPCDVFLSMGGHAKLLDSVEIGLRHLPKASELGLGQLALALDALRLGLRSDTCVDRLLSGRHMCRHGRDCSRCSHCSRCSGGNGSQSQKGTEPMIPLGPLAVEALEQIAAHAPAKESWELVLATLAAATASVRLLAVLVDLPIFSGPSPPEHIASALRGIFERHPLSLQLTSAVKHLVCRRCKRGWFGSYGNGKSFSRSLRASLAAENVTGACARAALRTLNEGHFRKLMGVEDRPQGVKAEARACGRRYILLATLYENVEAIACSVHGPGAAAEESFVELRSLCDESRSEEEPPAPSRSLRSNLGNLRGKIREKGMAPYVK